MRPWVIISPDEITQHLGKLILAPLTHSLTLYPKRVICDIHGDKGAVMLDQIRTFDKARIRNFMASLNAKVSAEIKLIINQMLC